MMVYKIHLFRVLVATCIFASLVFFLAFFSPPQKCVQVSVSVQQWQPFHVKRTRVVQALDESLVTSSPVNFIVAAARFNFNKDVWFRTRLVSSLEHNATSRPDDDEGYGSDDYGESDNDYESYDQNDEYYNDSSDNRAFEDGDFDYNGTNKFSSTYFEPNLGIVTQMFNDFKDSLNSSVLELLFNSSPKYIFKHAPLISKNFLQRMKQKVRTITLINEEGIPIVEDGIFWSEELEKRAPKGAEDSEAQNALQRLRSLKVQRVESPTWNRCGRPKNQYVVFEDGSKACARYRSPHQYLVQGEVLCFYLSRLLGIKNVPVVSLIAVTQDFGAPWSKPTVKQNLIASKWETNTTVALIQWIDHLERDKMPLTLLHCLIEKKVLSANSAAIFKLSVKKLVELLQWSDLVIFDYITGNYDRVASMQDAADKENKPSILHETIHNLVRSKSSGALWLIDNESGLLDSYSLLYGSAGQDGRFLGFHKQMLSIICLFRRSTVERIRWLHHSKNAGRILMDFVRKMEPLFAPVKKEKEISKRLQERIAEVNNHIERCLADVP